MAQNGLNGATMTPHDLAEHTTALLSLLSVLATVAAFLFWRLIADVRDRVKALTDMHIKFIEMCSANHALMIDKFPSRKEWEDWKSGREDIKKEQDALWEAFNHHEHNGGGRVIR